jgi:hypothetical protein
MPENLDPIEKARLRLLKRQRQREQDEQREKDQAAHIRKLEREQATRQAMLIGTTIRDEHLTENERVVVAGILNRRKEIPGDWYKIKRFTDVGSKPSDDADLGEHKPSRLDKKADDLEAAE